MSSFGRRADGGCGRTRNETDDAGLQDAAVRDFARCGGPFPEPSVARYERCKSGTDRLLTRRPVGKPPTARSPSVFNAIAAGREWFSKCLREGRKLREVR